MSALEVESKLKRYPAKSGLYYRYVSEYSQMLNCSLGLMQYGKDLSNIRPILDNDLSGIFLHK